MRRFLQFQDVLTTHIIRIWRWTTMLEVSPDSCKFTKFWRRDEETTEDFFMRGKVFINSFHQTCSNVEAAGMWVTVTVCWRLVRVRDYRMVMSITSGAGLLVVGTSSGRGLTWTRRRAASGAHTLLYSVHNVYTADDVTVGRAAARGRVRERKRAVRWTLRRKLGSSVVG